MFSKSSIVITLLAIANLSSINAYVCIENIPPSWDDTAVINLVSNYGNLDTNDIATYGGYAAFNPAANPYQYYDASIGSTLTDRRSVVVKFTSSQAETNIASEAYQDASTCQNYGGGLDGYAVEANYGTSQDCTHLFASIGETQYAPTEYGAGNWEIQCATGNRYVITTPDSSLPMNPFGIVDRNFEDPRFSNAE